MKKYLEIFPIELEYDKRFQHESYPHSGVFEVTTKRTERKPIKKTLREGEKHEYDTIEIEHIELVYVDKINNWAMSIAILKSPIESSMVKPEIIEAKAETTTELKEVAGSINMSEDGFLKALAISQNPELIKDVI